MTGAKRGGKELGIPTGMLLLSSFVVQDVRRILCGNHVLLSLQRKKTRLFCQRV